MFIAPVATMPMSISPSYLPQPLLRTWQPALATLLVGVTLGLGACTIPIDSEQVTTTYVTITPEPLLPAPEPSPSQTTLPLAELVSAAEAETGAQLGVALGEEVAGSIQGGTAWSTAKVPVAIAALRHNPELAPTMWPAITASDNEAAQQLWDALGGGQIAAEATNTVLREGGDAVTMTQPEVTREGFTAFGQTQWQLVDQARFATQLSQLPGAVEVVEAMGNISPDQQYGLGSFEGAVFKGGWGPEPDGRYLVRQFGVVPTATGNMGVAVIAIGPDFGSAQAALSVLTDKLHTVV